MSETMEQHEFGAEVGRLLDLVVHALYSDREIFLRELVANSADATDRRRFEALSQPGLSLPEAQSPAIRITPDKPARTLTISDSGIGMDREALVQNLGTIARSGTRAFGANLADAKPEDRPSLIGQFGVGFYSAFMVADRVEVTSRQAGTETAWCWASDGRGGYTIAPAARDSAGTSILLHMRADADEYLDAYALQSIIRKWADHITTPIMIVDGTEEIAANEGTALWRKPKAEISDDEYREFYQHLGHVFDKPWATLHWRAEGAIEFTALLFIPGSKPFEAVQQERDSRVRLHVRRMFITDEAGLLPPFLRFVTGIVDTEDLPLNVSREMLQTTPALARIRKAVTSRVLTELKTRSKDADEYNEFWDNFGAVLKEGVWEDAEYRQELAPLLRFRCSKQDTLISLSEYIAAMKPDQTAIYYLTGDNPDALARSPQLEGFNARDIPVLLLTDQVDSFWPERLGQFDGKSLRSVTQSTDDLAKFVANTPLADTADVSVLLPALKEVLKADVSDVRSTDRLVDSPAVLAASAQGPDLQMQRLLRRAGRTTGPGLPILEINPRSDLIRTLVAHKGDIGELAGTLLDLARIQDGEQPRDPAAFARYMAKMIAQTCG